MTTRQPEQLDYQPNAIGAVVRAFEKQSPNTFANSYFTEIQASVSERSPIQFTKNIAAVSAENLAALDATLAIKETSLTMQFDADLLLEHMLLKQGFGFARTVERLEAEFPKNTVYQVRDGERGALVCLDTQLAPETVDTIQARKPVQRFVCLELALDTTRKWTLTQHLGQLLTAL